MPAEAQTFNMVVEYRCTGGIAGTDPVMLKARVQIPTSIETNTMLSLGWTVEYMENRRFLSPDYFPAGAQVALVGNVKLEGAWNGVLQPQGAVEQGSLKPTEGLKVPEGMSSEAHMTREGVIKLTPQELEVDFIPPAGEQIVNNDALDRIEYTGSWKHRKRTPPEYGDHLLDVHTTEAAADTATIEFLGTGFEYIGRRQPKIGDVQVVVDDDDSATVYPSRTETGEPTNSIQGNTTLWRRDDLPYGQHKVTISGLEDGKRVFVDAFKILTKEMIDPPTLHRATCTAISTPDAVEINVGGGTPDPDPSDTDSPDPDPSEDPSEDPGEEPTPSTTPSVTPSSTPPVADDVDRHVSVVVTGETTPTVTTSATVTVTNTQPQVKATPKGGVDTGEAPERDTGSVGLLAAGSLLLMGSVTSGLVMRRRRAEHAGGMYR
ncbi:hypothetical protein AB0J42_30170 [Nonomuraea sp. NPDC049649]|uniref:hypothetical protein n=1 Tax=Nonomuraea sp. NPDC049649 TaxID=3155776 RepID=UPI003435A3A2